MKFSVVLSVLLLCLGNGICRYSSYPSRRNYIPAKHAQSSTFEYYTNKGNLFHRNQLRNSVAKTAENTNLSTRTSTISIPIMIHLDKALTKDLTKSHHKTVKRYFRDVLKSVEALFRHPSLNQTVYLDLLGVKKLSNATKNYQMNENVSKYLKSYCKWQGQCKLVKKEWYYSVLFTGLDVYYLDRNNKQVRSNTGRSYLRGVCSTWNSCSLLKWRPNNIAYVMAHELAHSLGISHDGPPYNQCRDQQYIMGAKYNPRKPATAWSPCNKQALEKFLETKHARCLHENT